MASRFTSIKLGPNDDGRRLDRVARKVLDRVPLGRIYAAIRSGEIRINGRRTTGNARVASGDVLDIRSVLAGPRLVGLGANSATPADPPGTMSLAGRIVFESADILAVVKERGELVHGPDSLATRVESYLGRKRPVGSGTAGGVSFRPGPVHRLDRNTSGLVVFSVSLHGAQTMSELFRQRKVVKRYVAVLSGAIGQPQEWTGDLKRDEQNRITSSAQLPAAPGGRNRNTGQTARTTVLPVMTRNGVSLVVAGIETGRTHQIRAHAKANGTPLLGDRKYAGPPLPGGYILHAAVLAPTEPVLGIDFPTLLAPLPEGARQTIVRLFGDRSLNLLDGALESGVSR